ncbi:MAG: hypothetical protein NZ898_07145 [Myxococcota bacterium]|nr:hypothetical protein [Myxococcota bacterium]MDW8362585.1 hypothetical protein [Myxococcales bacterium]
MSMVDPRTYPLAFGSAVLLSLAACDCGGGGGGTGGSDGGPAEGSPEAMAAADAAAEGGDEVDPGHFDGWVPADSPFVTDDAGFVLCGTERCQCSNGADDDGDGTADGFDAECTGPYDDDEGSFATGIPGDNRDPNCQDCFFDGNSGSGDDGCRYATSCLTEGTPSSGSGACRTCEVSERCREACRPRTPNGCDCFGCCQVFLDGGETIHVMIGGSCTLERIEDATVCPRCMPDDDCLNPCGECELCLGRTPEELPAHCRAAPDAGTYDAAVPDGGAPYRCDDGITCGPGLPACPPGYFCQLGCCMPTLI